MIDDDKRDETPIGLLPDGKLCTVESEDPFDDDSLFDDEDEENVVAKAGGRKIRIHR